MWILHIYYFMQVSCVGQNHNLLCSRLTRPCDGSNRFCSPIASRTRSVSPEGLHYSIEKRPFCVRPTEPKTDAPYRSERPTAMTVSARGVKRLSFPLSAASKYKHSTIDTSSNAFFPTERPPATKATSVRLLWSPFAFKTMFY